MFFHIAFRCQFYNLFLTWCPKTWFWDLLLNRLVPKMAPEIWFFEKMTSFSQRCGRPPAVLEATGATEAARGAQSIIFMIFDTFRLHFHGFVTNVWLITGSFFIELWQIVFECWHCFRTYFCRSPNDKQLQRSIRNYPIYIYIYIYIHVFCCEPYMQDLMIGMAIPLFCGPARQR